MEPILDRTPGRGSAKLHEQIAGVIFVVLLGLGTARADTSGFTGDFAEAFWTNQVQLGSVNFSNSDTVLALAGPHTSTAPESSFDGILYNGPLPGGLAVGGTVQFNWEDNPQDSVGSSWAAIAWTPSGGSSVQYPLSLVSGPGGIQTGSFSTNLLAGTTFEFLLSTDTLANKVSGTLTITSFEFHADVPEPTTGALLGSALICLGAARRWRCRRQASSQP